MRHKGLIRRLQISCLGLDPIDPLRLLVDDVIEALRENAMREVQRLGQEIEQEPVAFLSTDSLGERYLCFDKPQDDDPVQPLYTHPPQRTWVGLTDEEAQWLYDNCRTPSNLIDMVEAKLKEKNSA